MKTGDKTTKPSATADPDKETCAKVLAALEASAPTIEALLGKSLKDPSGRVPSFK